MSPSDFFIPVLAHQKPALTPNFHGGDLFPNEGSRDRANALKPLSEETEKSIQFLRELSNETSQNDSERKEPLNSFSSNLQELFFKAVINEDDRAVSEILSSSHAFQVLPRELGKALGIACFEGYAKVVSAMISSPLAQKIPSKGPNGLEAASIHAFQRGNEAALSALFSS